MGAHQNQIMARFDTATEHTWNDALDQVVSAGVAVVVAHPRVEGCWCGHSRVDADVPAVE